MKLLTLFVAVLAQIVSAQAQSFTPDCSGKLDVASCRTFQTMLSEKKPELLSMFTGHSYTCFRHDEDTFFVISFTTPKETSAPGAATLGNVMYHRFKRGVSDDFRKIAGNWKNDDNQLTFTSTADSKLPPAEQTRAFVDQRSIVVSYSFLNHEKAQVHYKLQLRREGLDYLEDYTWQSPQADKPNSATYAGSCIEDR